MKKSLSVIASLLALTAVVNAGDKPVAADNTGKNERDKSGQTATPFDQSESDADLQITVKIRQEVIKDDDLSLLAKNVKIITSDSRVVLRGPVKSEAEKEKIAVFAKSAGAGEVINQLEVK